MGVNVDLEIGEHREEPNLSTQRKGTLVTFSSAPALTLEKVGVSIEPTHPSITAPVAGMIMITQEFLQSLVYS